MTDEPFGDEAESGEDFYDEASSDGAFAEGAFFDDAFFASLAADPDDPVEDPGADFDGLPGGDGEFRYEAEGDGSFETDTAGFDDEAFEPEPDLDFEGGFDPGADPDLGPDL